MKRAKRVLKGSLFFLSLFCLWACNESHGNDIYPNIITELADGITDTEGNLTKLELDNNTILNLTNPQTGLTPNAVYRCLAGYTTNEQGTATLRSAVSAYLLHDSTAVATTDPVAIVSAWRTPRYINFHLRPKTQGGKQTWGIIVDSIVGRHAYLRLHHRQGTDPTAYSTNVYASLFLSDIEADDFTINIETFSGTVSREL
ncbi:MAG: NigD-like protein [Bacteroidaceae bacterium]|nr:NigD-like protein [Bacteroidaceae bacterium]